MSGVESLGVSKAGQTVLAGLMESQIWHQLAGSVALGGEGLEKGQWPLLTLMPNTSVSPSMLLVSFKLLPQCWSSERVSLSKSICGFFKGNCLGLQKFLSSTQCPLVFAARSYGDLPSQQWNPGLWGLVWGLDSSLKISLLNCYPPHVDGEPACSMSLPLLPVWMDVVSLIL